MIDLTFRTAFDNGVYYEDIYRFSNEEMAKQFLENCIEYERVEEIECEKCKRLILYNSECIRITCCDENGLPYHQNCFNNNGN